MNAAILARIGNSAQSLEVRYPPVRAVVVTTTTPLSPLTGGPHAPALIPVAPVASQPPKTMPCLWLDVANTTRLVPLRVATRVENAGFVMEAKALARVAVQDGALDPDDPYAGTVFDACEDVVFQGKHYRVLQIDPVGHSFAVPVTYSVWLAGASKD